jgi:hypothetical protein
MSYELPAAPLSIGGVLDSAIRLYRDSIRRSWVLALLYSAALAVFGLVWALTLGNVVGPAKPDPRQIFAMMFSPVMLVTLAVGTVVSFVFYGALMKTLSAWAQGNEALPLGTAIAIGVRRLPAVLLGCIINGLAVAIGFILLIVPGVYIFGKMPLWMAAVFVDDVGAMEGLRRSWRLTRGRWWHGAVIITVAVIMIYVFALAFGLVSGAIGALAHLSLTGRQVINQLFAVASNMIVLPMFASILIVMYHDFKLRDEGGDLAARMGALGKV